MIHGIGTDIVEVKRFSKYDKEHHFVHRYFHPKEIEYMFRFKNYAEHMAGFFAAKEALVKAMGTGIRDGIELKDICIDHDSLGKPFFKLSGEIKKTVDSVNMKQIHLSISHCKEYATATAIIEKLTVDSE